MCAHNRWRLRAAALAVLALAVAAPGRGAEAGLPDRIQVKAAGGEHQARRDGERLALRGPGADGRSVRAGAPGEWLLQDAAGQVLLRARRGPGGEVELTGTDGRAVRTARPDPEGYRIFQPGPGGALAVRVKVKEDKFNVYDPAGKRLRHGKAKEYGFSVKDEAGARELKLEGPRSLREASFFALGLDFGEEVLWWRALGP